MVLVREPVTVVVHAVAVAVVAGRRQGGAVEHHLALDALGEGDRAAGTEPAGRVGRLEVLVGESVAVVVEPVAADVGVGRRRRRAGVHQDAVAARGDAGALTGAEPTGRHRRAEALVCRAVAVVVHPVAVVVRPAAFPAGVADAVIVGVGLVRVVIVGAVVVGRADAVAVWIRDGIQRAVIADVARSVIVGVGLVRVERLGAVVLVVRVSVAVGGILDTLRHAVEVHVRVALVYEIVTVIVDTVARLLRRLRGIAVAQARRPADSDARTGARLVGDRAGRGRLLQPVAVRAATLANRRR